MKTLIRSVFCMLALSLAATSNVYADAELEAFKAETRKKYKIKEQGYADNDINVILDQFYWSDTAISTGEGYDFHVGREGMRKLFEPVIHLTVDIRPVYSYVNGHMGYEWCDYYVYDKDKKTPFEKLRILFIWERINGEWYVKSDMYVNGTLDNPVK